MIVKNVEINNKIIDFNEGNIEKKKTKNHKKTKIKIIKRQKEKTALKEKEESKNQTMQSVPMPSRLSESFEFQ